MDIRKVKKLIELIEESDIAEIEIHEGEEQLQATILNSRLDMLLLLQWSARFMTHLRQARPLSSK